MEVNLPLPLSMGSWVQYSIAMKEKINKLLADFLGIEPSDMSEDDSLMEDLHMTPSDLTDFVEILSTAGFDTANLDMTEIETLSDLYEKYI